LLNELKEEGYLDFDRKQITLSEVKAFAK